MSSADPPTESDRDHDARRDPMAGRRAWVRADRARIEEHPDERGTYVVVITGHNLRMAISPPRIDVGGVPLTQLVFADDGMAIQGRLLEQPRANRVTVDFGFARDAVELSAGDEDEASTS